LLGLLLALALRSVPHFLCKFIMPGLAIDLCVGRVELGGVPMEFSRPSMRLGLATAETRGSGRLDILPL
jgi:hypothetical protein